MQLTEREQSRRHSWDQKAIDYQDKEVRRGQWMGFVLGMLTLGGGIFCASIGQPWVAVIMVGTSLAGILTAFRKGRSKK